MTVKATKPQKGETCLDLGASPGGWTHVLLNLGALVDTCDRSDLADNLMNHPNLKMFKSDAFKVQAEGGRWGWEYSILSKIPTILKFSGGALSAESS